MSGQGEDLFLKVLQLECIIESKNKELQLLREHLSEDQEVCTLTVCLLYGLSVRLYALYKRATGVRALQRVHALRRMRYNSYRRRTGH